MAIQKDNTWWLWVLILTAGLLVRVGGGIIWQWRIPEGRLFFFPDSESYWALGRAIALGEPYQFGPDGKVFRTPGYPLLLASVIVWWGDGRAGVYAARVMNAVLGTVAVGLVGVWARSVAGRSAARLALLAAAFYPGAIAMAVLVLSEAAFCPAMLAQLICWSIADQHLRQGRRAWVWAAAGGLAAGLATLCRPSWLLFTPVVCVVWLATVRFARRYLAAGLVMLAALALVMTPWWVRNYVTVGRFVPTTLQVGASLYDGWNPHATGGSDMSHVDTFRQQWEQSVGARPGGADTEVALDRALWNAAVQWAVKHPGDVARLAVVKFLRMWSLWPNDATLRGGWWAWVLAATYVVVLVLGAAGAARLWRRGWPVWFAIAPAVYLTLLHMIFVGSVRYREPAMLAWMVLMSGVGCRRSVPERQ